MIKVFRQPIRSKLFLDICYHSDCKSSIGKFIPMGKSKKRPFSFVAFLKNSNIKFICVLSINLVSGKTKTLA